MRARENHDQDLAGRGAGTHNEKVRARTAKSARFARFFPFLSSVQGLLLSVMPLSRSIPSFWSLYPETAELAQAERDKRGTGRDSTKSWLGSVARGQKGVELTCKSINRFNLPAFLS